PSYSDRYLSRDARTRPLILRSREASSTAKSGWPMFRRISSNVCFVESKEAISDPAAAAPATLDGESGRYHSAIRTLLFDKCGPNFRSLARADALRRKAD